MNCPKCGEPTYTIDTRESNKYDKSIRRRRVCYKCKMRFTTYEVVSGYIEGCEIAKNSLEKIKEIVE